MTTTEVDLRRPQAQPSAIPAKLAYAEALANSGLLPGAYRKQPANILWAVEYGDMLGLSTMAAITGVHVIEGKPTASAGLISALVRRAGHKLRVHGNNKSATCQIIRSDDPGHPFEVTWTLRKNDDGNPSAEEAKLLSKDVWQKYPAAMLKSRAITQCARDACEEALFGLHYTAEELGANVDGDGVVVDDPPRRRGTVVIDPDCLVENEASRLADRSGGTPDDDQWYVRPEPGPDDGQHENGQRWADTAIAQAARFKSEAEGQKLWRESAAAVLDGRATPGEATHIQNIITARVADRRKEAAGKILQKLADDDPWRAKVEELPDGDNGAALAALEELAALVPDQIDMDRGNLISRAIIARFPKAALKDGDGGA